MTKINNEICKKLFDEDFSKTHGEKLTKLEQYAKEIIKKMIGI